MPKELKLNDAAVEILTRDYEFIFSMWLEESDLTVCEFMEFRNVEGFRVEKEQTANQVVFTMKYKKGDAYLSIGAPFKIENENDYIDAIYLIMYIINKWDKENFRNPDDPDEYIEKKRHKYFCNELLRFADLILQNN